ncbi:MAG TPA: hypothetical protein VL853_03675, partial [Gemmatimonadales bacterium]|nr:hypothetical protein [Gemmatimonadales bacterium]
MMIVVGAPGAGALAGGQVQVRSVSHGGGPWVGFPTISRISAARSQHHRGSPGPRAWNSQSPEGFTMNTQLSPVGVKP